MLREKQSIFREINDGDDCTDIVIHCIAYVALAGAAMIILIAGWSIIQREFMW